MTVVFLQKNIIVHINYKCDVGRCKSFTFINKQLGYKTTNHSTKGTECTSPVILDLIRSVSVGVSSGASLCVLLVCTPLDTSSA